MGLDSDELMADHTTNVAARCVCPGKGVLFALYSSATCHPQFSDSFGEVRPHTNRPVTRIVLKSTHHLFALDRFRGCRSLAIDGFNLGRIDQDASTCNGFRTNSSGPLCSRSDLRSSTRSTTKAIDCYSMRQNIASGTESLFYELRLIYAP